MKFNIPGYQRKIIIVGLLSSLLLLLQGCGSGRKGITIDSDPQGADILADGKNIGKTPMQIKQDDVFPPHWYGRSYMVKGKLEIQKEGCEGVSMEVNDLVLSKDIRKNLTCKPGIIQKAPVANMPGKKKPVTQKPAAQKAVPAAIPVTVESRPAVKASSVDDEIENRLSRLKGLRDRGVISSKEYTEQRKRILESI
ncbi:PEGA domain protein [bacterium BMS3Bbin11]|nr:PEGA domain protein [bacterium BMS3Abin11]GBE46295.1 PEGA domain protein [bacterium BMS3Bbin11]HDH14885.1 PEGA domain-containing protein [Gammaproteobacteria bacterium]HDZ77817.1 PEGA domain-containing protein [Gammaproteobacteria bacterium]